MIALGIIGLVFLYAFADPIKLWKPTLLGSGFLGAVLGLWWAVGGGRTWI